MQTSTYESTSPRNSEKLMNAKNQLTSDFNALVSDAEAFLKSTASYSGEAVTDARMRFQDTLNYFKGRIGDTQPAAMAKFDRAATATHTYVHDNPWKVVGIAAAIGLLVGILLHNSNRK